MMDYIITENRLNKLLDKLFIQRYGDYFKKKVDGNYVFFHDEIGVPFEINEAGTLWVNDYPFLKYVKKLLGLTKQEEVDEVFRNYFKEKYDVDVITAISEGGYTQKQDSNIDIDPWLDQDYVDEFNILAESKIDNMVFKFLDDYLKDYSPEENNDLILYGRGKKNVIAYDKNERLLMVADSLMTLVHDMFNLSNIATTRVFRDYIESKGLEVKRMH